MRVISKPFLVLFKLLQRTFLAFGQDLLNFKVHANDDVCIAAARSEENVIRIGNKNVLKVKSRIKIINDALVGVGQEETVVRGDQLGGNKGHAAVILGSVSANQFFGVGIRQAVACPKDLIAHVEELARVIPHTVIILCKYAFQSQRVGIKVIKLASAASRFSNVITI